MKQIMLLGFLLFFQTAMSSKRFTYDNRTFFIDGERTFIFSGSIHYPRSTPKMWPRLANLARYSGLNMIQTYVFWNIHEPEPLKYDFETGRKNLTLFLDILAENDLFVDLRIGPYVCAEWNYGGIPGWARNYPGMEFRTNTDPWKMLMKRFIKKTLEVVEPYLQHNGGPIVLLQVENEYGNVEDGYSDSKEYVEWCVNTANELEPDETWIMCQENDAPKGVIKTCNGFVCQDWIAQYKPENAPAMYTEDWTGWFTAWGGARNHRRTEDLLYSALLWFLEGGAHINYYMFHGGTNFGRTGAHGYITSYDYDTALNEYGFPYCRKYSSLTWLHGEFINAGIAFGEVQSETKDCGNGITQYIYDRSSIQIFVNPNPYPASPKDCFPGPDWPLNARSVRWFYEGRQVFDSVDDVLQSGEHPWEPEKKTSHSTLLKPMSASIHPEPTHVSVELPTVSNKAPLDQLLFNDTSDYLWYSAEFAKPEQITEISIDQPFDTTYVYASDQLVGTCAQTTGTCQLKFPQPVVVPSLEFLSVTFGVANAGVKYEQIKRGLMGKITGLPEVTSWKHQNSLLGEALSFSANNSVAWKGISLSDDVNPLTWVKLAFWGAKANDSALEALALDLSSMGKGMAFVNGHMIGRYWDIKTPTDLESCKNCDITHLYDPNTQCGTGCGEVTQSLYHVPPDWWNETGANDVVIFTETGGSPGDVTLELVKSSTFFYCVPPFPPW